MRIVYIFSFWCIALAVAGQGPAWAETFKIASYNVENLFDLKTDKTEYPDYQPNGRTGWTRAMLSAKLANITRVIKDLDADIVALQEIETRTALDLLQQSLANAGAVYEYSAISRQPSAAVKCALLSRFPVTAQESIAVGKTDRASARHILKVRLKIADRPLIVYVNHWKSKAGPESRRMVSAETLAREIESLGCDTDYVLTGDFNSDYNEYETFQKIERLNDTGGRTGINHLLGTTAEGRLVDESFLAAQNGCGFLYNLWLEVPAYRRWSVNFFGRKNSPDSIIVPKALYDDNGISYVDDSFDRFDPDYLFAENRVFRWQRAARNGKPGTGRHLGRGFSDHLPVVAKFSTAPFRIAGSSASAASGPPAVATIADLYRYDRHDRDAFPVRLENAVVIYRHRENAVLKQRNGRAVYVYRAAPDLATGRVCHLTVTAVNRFYGNFEITGLRDIQPVDTVPDLSPFYLSGNGYGKVSGREIDFSAPELCNEVISQASGIVADGWFFYGDNHKIRIYFKDPARAPKDFSSIVLHQVRIGYHHHPEIIVEKLEQSKTR